MVIKNPVTIVKGSGGSKTPTDWGRLYVYDWKEELMAQDPYNCEILSLDEALLKAAIEADPNYTLGSPLPSDWTVYTHVDANYNPSEWELAISYDNYDTGDTFDFQVLNLATSDLESTWGIQVQITDDTQYAHFYMEYSSVIYTEGAVSQIVLPSEQAYEQLGAAQLSQDGQHFILPVYGGLLVPLTAVVGFDFGSQPQTVPDTFLPRCTNLTSVDMTANTSITSIPRLFLSNCASLTELISFPSSVTSIGDNFMNNCTSFNSPIDFSHVTTFGIYFMEGCSAFNQYVDLSSAVTIGGSFLRSCTAFGQSLTIPSTVTTALTGFMYDTRQVTELTINSTVSPTVDGSTLASYVNTAPMYVAGVTLKGPGRSVWLSALPNKDTRSYRKLIDGGD